MRRKWPLVPPLASRCLQLTRVASRCLPLLAFSFTLTSWSQDLCTRSGLFYLTLPSVASRCLQSPPLASRCLPLPPVASRCLPLPPAASLGRSWCPIAVRLVFRLLVFAAKTVLASIIVIHPIFIWVHSPVSVYK